MKNRLMVLFLSLSVFVFAGCSRKPVGHYPPIHSQRPASTTTRYVNSEAMQHPAHLAPNLHWRCTVGNRHQTWYAVAGTLVAAQSKAKLLCEQMSNTHDFCRYKGCVQVES